MLSLLRLERKQKNSSNPFRIRIFLFLSYSFGIETINTFIHSCSSLENHPRFQTKMGKMYTRFQNKTAQKNHPDGAAHTYVAYIREYLSPRGGGGGRWTHSWFQRSLCFWQHDTVSTGNTRVTVITQPFSKARLPFISYDDFTLERG